MCVYACCVCGVSAFCVCVCIVGVHVYMYVCVYVCVCVVCALLMNACGCAHVKDVEMHRPHCSPEELLSVLLCVAMEGRDESPD